MRYDSIFFDVGNTLYFYNYDFLCGLLSERFDIEVDGAELAAVHRRAQLSVVREGLEGRTHEELWGRTYRRWFEMAGIDGEKAGEAIDAVRTHPFRHLFWSRMEEGTREMLDWFRERGFRLGVISNAEGQIRRLLEHTGINSRFDVVVDSSEVGVAKPDARIFRMAVEGVRSSPERCVHVGDMVEIDVAGARGAGITPILVDRDGATSEPGLITVARATDLPKLSIFSGI
ncbi:MAG: HAD family hydrolase [Proteobacteria bacterium]|nr:HAD family hydrolase [Pseudomonadota bacterium]